MLKSLITSLTEANGPSGYEKPVRELVKGTIAAYVDELCVDQMGNLIARKGTSRSNSKRMMLTAHLDEIGLMVSHIDEHGFARFTPLGSWNVQAAIGSKVVFLKGPLGIIGCENPIENQKDLSTDQLFIDLGASSQQDCPVKLGDVAVFASNFMELGERIVGKALDDRVGVALLIEVIRQMSEQKIAPCSELYFVFSSQGQLKSRGVTSAAFRIEPDISISVDLAASGGTPKSPFSAIEMGNGPAIRIRDQMMFSEPYLIDWIRETAEKVRIHYQYEICEKNDLTLYNLQTSRSGIAAAGLSIPARFLRTPNEMADYNDIQNAFHLLMALIAEPFPVEK